MILYHIPWIFLSISPTEYLFKNSSPSDFFYIINFETLAVFHLGDVFANDFSKMFDFSTQFQNLFFRMIHRKEILK